MLGVRVRGRRREAVFFFRLKLNLPEVKACPQIGTLAKSGQRRAFTPVLILFIALPETKDNTDPG